MGPMEAAWAVLKSAAEDAMRERDTARSTLTCPGCGWEGPYSDTHGMGGSCPQCGAGGNFLEGGAHGPSWPQDEGKALTPSQRLQIARNEWERSQPKAPPASREQQAPMASGEHGGEHD